MTSYACGICGTKRDQRSHHKLHLDSEKHKQSKELFRHQLKDMDADDRRHNYFTDDIGVIIGHIETQEYNKDGDLVNDLRMYAVHNITNKDALRDKIHDIHNFLRNNGIGYGMNALKAFNVLYGLMRIEESGLFDKVDLPMECRFSYLVDLSKKNKHEQATGLILGKVLDSIIQHKKMKHFLFYELPKNVRADVYSQLVLQIHELRLIEKSCGVQLSGKIYEYFIGRDDTAISEMGAYFTDRHIVEFINREEPPHIDEDGHVSTMIDPFGGSGGFTNGGIQCLTLLYPDLKWENELKNIYHYDMNEDVNKSAALEMFCLTGEIPVMNENVLCCNSFTSDFCNLKFKQVRTNPPYGGDKSKQTDAQQKRDKMISHIKGLLDKPKGFSVDKLNVWKLQLKRLEQEKKKDKARSDKQKVSLNNSSLRIKKFAKKHGLKGNDKEAVSLILLMDILDEDGTAVGVLKEGVFFNKSYKDVRECVIKNFNVRKVISVPSDQFENTTTKTSIIVFDNTEQKTTKVEFSELVVEKYEEDVFVEGDDGSILLVENKGDIKGVSKKIVVEVDVGRMKENDWSLNGKDYVSQKIVAGDGYNTIYLGEICVMNKGTPLAKKNYVDGPYPVIGGGKTPSGFHKEYNREAFTTICSASGSAGYISRYDTKVWASDSFSIECSDPVLSDYIFYFLKNQQEYIYTLQKGSVQPHVYPKDMGKMVICTPKSREKMRMWVDKISKPYHEMHEKKKQFKQLHQDILNRVDSIIKNVECIEHKIGSVCKFVSGKFNRQDMKGTGEYPFYNSNTNTPLGFHDKFCFDGDLYCIFTKSGGNLKNKVSETHSLGLPSLVSGKIATTVDVLKVETKLNPYYVYFQLLLMRPDLQDKAKYSTSLGHVDMDHLKSLSFYIPKNDTMSDTFHQYSKLKNDIDHTEKLYSQYIKELGEEAIVSH